MKKQPKAVYIIENGEYTELTYEEFRRREQICPLYADKLFLPLYGRLMEVSKEDYEEYYRQRNRQIYIDRRASRNGDVSYNALTTDEFNGEDRIAVKCKECGYEWTPKAYSLIQGRSCRYCSAKRGAKNNSGKTGLKTQQQFLSEMSKVHPTIKVVGEYLNGHADIQCTCSVCSHSWKAKPYSLLQGHGCPRCAKSGTSFMEQFIKGSFEKALGEDSVLSRDKTAIGMELDIYIPSFKIAIEPGNWLLHKKSLNRDKTKRERCKEKGIRLITIYDKFPLTEQIPFENDCFVFNDDLNKADHSVIKDLVKRLFDITNIQYGLSDSQWSTIERQSYDNAKAKTHEDFIESMSAVHPTIEVLGKYVNANKKLLVKCTVCEFEWDGVPANMLAGDGCRKCGTKLAHKKFVKEQDEFEEQVRKANPDIEVIGTYTGRHNPIQAKCRICGYIWSTRASSLLRGSNHKGWKTIHKSTVILIELRWAFSVPENRLKSRLLPFLSINEPRRRAILRRGFVLFARIAAFCTTVIVKQPSSDNTPYEKIGDEVRSLADEVPFDIPDSWEWVRLSTISSYAETKQKINAASTDPSIWGLDLEDIEKGGRLLEHKTVGERKAVGDKTVFAKGDILYSKLRPYLLKILVAPDDGICTPEIVPFRVYGGINPNYIVNYLK